MRGEVAHEDAPPQRSVAYVEREPLRLAWRTASLRCAGVNEEVGDVCVLAMRKSIVRATDGSGVNDCCMVDTLFPIEIRARHPMVHVVSR